MKLTRISRALLAIGLTTGAASAFALEAWNGQEGGDTMQVIFDGSVYQNAWWVAAANCPKDAAADEANNPWRYLRTATSAEIAEYGNPTSCDINGGGTPVVHETFSTDKAYKEGDIVMYQDNSYKANGAVPAYSFIPAEGNPWQLYTPVDTWIASKTYNKGDVVKVNGQSYEALFYTIGDDPSNPANQNPDNNNGRPWKPLGATVEYTPEQLAAAPQFSAATLYPAGQLVQFRGQPYVAQAKVQHASPTDANPWAVYIDWAGTKERVGTPKNPWPAHVYAPYVDFSLNSIPDLAKLAKEQNVNHFTMAFVVAKSGDQCLPTWGTAYNLQDYTQYSKIKALREAGGDIMVSIGGANNAPLAAACKNDADLTQLYHDIVDNLNLNVLDFDIEGTWVADHESIQRRNRAVKAVQAKWKEEGRKVGIWYTLPILPTGLTAEGLYVLEDARDAGVDLAGINVMTMDYGNSVCQSDNTEGQNIHGTCATSAIDNMSAQLKKIWPAKSDKEINAMMGTTPMIGYNDVQGEVFYQSDAKLVMEDAVKRDLGMIGIWSMARDQPGIAKQVSPEHSGMTEQQAPMYAYSKIFAPFTHVDDEINPALAALKGFEVVISNGVPMTSLSLDRPAHEARNMNYTIELNGKYWAKSQYNRCYEWGTKKTDTVNDIVTCSWGIPLKVGDTLHLWNYSNGVQTPLETITVSEKTLEGKTSVAPIIGEQLKGFALALQEGKPVLQMTVTQEAHKASDVNFSIELNGKYIGKSQNGSIDHGKKTINTETNMVTGTWTNQLKAGDKIKLYRFSNSVYTPITETLLTSDMLKNGGSLINQ